MRNAALTAGLVTLVCCATAFGAPRSDGTVSPIKLLQREQKIARKQLQTEQKVWKKSYRGQHIPRAELLNEKHQFQRNMRNLRMQQKNQIQEYKDQQRLARYAATHPTN